jgi:NAD(P)-dependent dehydrogenase (short-subunit alcohol dehydrogenase family)
MRDAASDNPPSAALHAALLLGGAALGAVATGGAALLIYTERGFLATTGFVVALIIASAAAGIWVSGGSESDGRGPWSAAILAFGVAAAFAAAWLARPGLREAALGGPLAVLFILAAPAYTGGLLLARLSQRPHAQAAAALAGVALGVLVAATWGIPRFDAPFLLLGASGILAFAALFDPRGAYRARSEPMNPPIALITGVGNAGQVGYAIAEAFIRSGARVVVTDIDARVEELARRLGGETLGVRADLTREDEAARVVAAVVEAHGRLDVVVNAAGGLGVVKSVETTSAFEWSREFERNATTAFLLSRAALPKLRQSRGSIISFSSPAAASAPAKMAAYSAAKGAIDSLTRSLAREERDHGVRVNAIAPGMIDTEQNRADAEPGARFVRREDIAALVLFLASPAAAAISGQTIPATATREF